MITKSIFAKLIRAMEGVHDLEETICEMLGRQVGAEGDCTIGRLYSLESVVMDILGFDNASELLEIAGSDMDLEKKVNLLMKMYPGKITEDD